MTPGRSVERTVLRKGRKYSFEVVRFEGAGGRTLEHEVVRHPGSVTVLPLLDDPARGRCAVLIENERIAVGETLVELPAGTMDKPGEPAEKAAARELEEETGYRARSMRRLGGFYTTPGLTDEWMEAFVAEELTPVGQRLEADERITVRIVRVPEALAMVEEGRIRDAKTALVLLWASRLGLLERGGSPTI